MEINGNQRKSMKINGNPMKTNGKAMEINGNQLNNKIIKDM